MANYINKDILCQAYIHIDPVPIDKNELEDFKAALEAFLSTRGKFFIYDEVDADVELKDGSLKVYATVVGSLYLAIAQYGSFRSGVDYLASDVKRLSETLVSESLFQSKSRHDNIIRAEARIGVAGRLKQLVDEIEFVESRVGEDSPRVIAKRLETIAENTQQLLDKLNDPQDIPYLKENLTEVAIESIREKPFPLPKSPKDEEGESLYIVNRRQLLGLLKT